MITSLLAALRTGLASYSVAFHESTPNKLYPPSVIVSPGDPFLEPATQGLIQEHWEILVCMNRTASDRGVSAYRNVSLAVAAAVQSVGAVWEETSGPRLVENEDTSYVLVINRVRFKYAPADLDESSSSSS